MIRIVTLERQPLMRRGLEAALREQRDLVPVGAAAEADELWPLLYRTDPDVVLLGVDDPRAALELCMRVKSRPLPPRVVLYADPDPALVVPAALARADGIAERTKPTPDLLWVIRDAAGGRSALPPVCPREQAAAAARLDPRDHAIFAMALAGTPRADIAATLRLGRRELARRAAAIVARLARPEQRPLAVGGRPLPA